VLALNASATPHRMILRSIVGIKSTQLAAVAFGAFHRDKIGKRSTVMALGDWMDFDVPMEQKFEVEQECRRIETHPEAGTLAAILLRQNHMLQHLLNKAVHEVARLESQLP
jgi:hypothetical protein